MRLSFAAALAAALLHAACHLADDPEPPKCEVGFHVDTGRCVADKVSGITVAIKAGDGGGCVVLPEAITVPSGRDFQFKNEDTVDHEVTGSDGQVWSAMKAGALSDMMVISKVGSWTYSVSGCARGGTVVIE